MTRPAPPKVRAGLPADAFQREGEGRLERGRHVRAAPARGVSGGLARSRAARAVRATSAAPGDVTPASPSSSSCWRLSRPWPWTTSSSSSGRPTVRASVQVSPELVITRSAAAISSGIRSVIPDRASPAAGGRDGRQPALEPGVAPGDGEDMHAGVRERLGRLRRPGPRPQAPHISSTQRSVLGTPRPLPGPVLGRRVVERGPDRRRHDLDPRARARTAAPPARRPPR